MTSPSLSAYDGEGGAGLLEVDEFGGLNGFSRPQTPYSSHSPTLSPSPLPEVNTVDKAPGKVVIPNKFQRRVVSDSQANYGFTRALTPDPEMSLRPLEEEAPTDFYSPPEAEPTPEAQTRDDPEELEAQPPSKPIPELQISTSGVPLPPSTIDPPREAPTETAPEPVTLNPHGSLPTPESIPVADGVEGEDVGIEDSQGYSDAVPTTQDQNPDPVLEVSKPTTVSVPSSPLMDSADVSPSLSPQDTPSSLQDTLSSLQDTPSSPQDTPSSPPMPVAGTPPVTEEDEQPASEPVDEVVSSTKITRGSDDVPTPEETPAPPALPFPQLSTDAPLADDASSQLQTPPESPGPASSLLTSVSDLSDSTIDYQSGFDHLDPDYDLFVLPLPKDDELPPRPIIQEVVVPRSMHQVLASPLPTLQAPVDFPIMTARSVFASSSDPNISFTGDESLALDASQAEIMIAQSEVIRPASPTLLVTMPSPPSSATTFRARTPPSQEQILPPLDKVDNARVSPPRIRKKLYTNHPAPTSFKDNVPLPPVQHSFSAVVHQKTRTSTFIPPDRVDSLPKYSKPANTFMTPKKRQSLFTEPTVPASPGSELAFLVKNAAILEAQLECKGNSAGDQGRDRPKNPAPSVTGLLPRSTLGSEMTKAKSASTPALVPTPALTPGHIPPMPDLVYGDRSSNLGLFSSPQIPSFLPQLRSRKSGPHEEADRKSLAPSFKSRKSEKSAKEKDKDSMPRARKLSSRLRSLASASSNSLRSLGRPSLSSETSVSFDGPTTVSIEPMTPQTSGSGENGILGVESPGSRSQISHGSGSEWNSPPRGRDVLGRASSFADRLLSRAGKIKSGLLENSQGTVTDVFGLYPKADAPAYRFSLKRLFESDEK